jgi:hypothetical protein
MNKKFGFSGISTFSEVLHPKNRIQRQPRLRKFFKDIEFINSVVFSCKVGTKYKFY